ncbi:hypothetical protein DL96DRAFT_1816261 [Flagelloscypha sp. PMI_526]|nr:hypothetical protein DL96DRAFT_1816261 [Flagelloscypha sp. PMI_526]
MHNLAAILASSMLPLSVLADPAITSSHIRREDYNALVWQGGYPGSSYCASTARTASKRQLNERDGTSFINVTVVQGNDPIEGVRNFVDYCIQPTQPPVSVPSTFSVENACYVDKTFVVNITDGTGSVTSSTFTLNVGGAEWEKTFSIQRPSTAVITETGTDTVITFDYPEYEAAETKLWSHVWWCDDD